MRSAIRAIVLAAAVSAAAGQMTSNMAPATMSAYCSPGCNTTHRGNGQCNFMCMNQACGFDSMGGASDCSPTNMLSGNIHPKAIIAANDIDANMRLNYTEMLTYDPQLQQINVQMFSLSAPTLGLDYYELSLMLFDQTQCAMMQNPSATIDWDVWAQPTAFWMLTVADSNMDGTLSPMELSATWPKLTANMRTALTNATGHASVASLAVQLGQLGSALHGQGVSPFWTVPDVVALLMALFSHTAADSVGMLELAPLCLATDLIQEFDVDKNMHVSASEMTSMLRVTNEDPCAGFVELKGQKLKVSAQIPLMPRKCAWMVNPQWFYRMPDETNSSLHMTAKNDFHVMPHMMAPATVTQGVRRLLSVEEGEDDNVIRATETRKHASSVTDRRLLAVLPSARVDSDDVITTRAMGTPAVVNEVPYNVALLNAAGAHVCDGVLINPKYVLTTASCAMTHTIAKAIIGGLTTTLPQDGVDEIMVAKTMTHPSYSVDHTNDVALAELSAASSKMHIDVYDGSDVGFTDCRMMSITALSRQAGVLTKKTVTTVPQATCVNHYWWYYGTRGAIGHDVLCVQGDVDNCDATLTKGGALYAVTPAGKHVLLGIKSDISVCNPLPVAYTRISQVRQWILSATMGGSVFPAMKLKVTVEKIMMPNHGTLKIYQGTYEDHANMAVELDSKCQAGHVSDDGGMGGVLIVYQPGNASRDTSCGPTCLDEQGFEIDIEAVGCEANFMAQANHSEGSCIDPHWHAMDGAMGGIHGCQYHKASMDGSMPAMCTSPMCEMTERWQALGPMEVAGTAFAGGLGHRMEKNQTHEYGVWTCVRDWNEDEQLRCGVRPNELGCYWFEEMTRTWSWRGVNGEARLVEKARYEQGLDAEEARLANHIILPTRRGDMTSHFEL
eukprot:CAMPEP_0173378848 /NCGR_PEP_ID=MMETSP1356-20130122/1963_1 /TAXON_ID=77927 ORGANISM="Hemiselmis virescens, Strain PCC157" /NCGR_SAMPLE_ID=MMETSP1356 /ASSEMBLY_ACC=CAM_ASM_000847 /LENGTH=896 /DNA_ID=CAMNT_0014332057 /DNA_START=81 /DNA_END=2771 /DNA_ORIENTATION=-